MEMKINMKNVTKKTERSLSNSLGEYVCIDPKESKQVFEYFRGLNKEVKDMVRVHLHLCLHCREKVAQDILRKRAVKALNHIVSNNGNGNTVKTENEEESHHDKAISATVQCNKVGI